MTSRRFACLTAASLLFAAGPALAQTPPPGPAPVPLSAVELGAGYAPYAAPGWYRAPQDTPPYTPLRRRSPGMIAGGVILISLASVGFIAGPALIAAGNRTQEIVPDFCGDFGCPSQMVSSTAGLTTAGITAIAVGVAALGAGIPLLVVGTQKVPDRGDEEAALVPSVRFGLGGASVGWRF